jgi:hypothetical protein
LAAPGNQHEVAVVDAAIDHAGRTASVTAWSSRWLVMPANPRTASARR